jgi:ureidoacrylate peracid hydrolase
MEADTAMDPKVLNINAKPSPVEIDLARAAVVVVDMQNAFLSEGGMFDQAGYDITGAAGAIEANAALLPAMRKAGVKVVYVKMSYNADYSDSGGPQSPNWHKELGLVLMQDRPETWGRYVTEDTWDEEIREDIAPCPEDVVVRKQRYSGFAGTNLDMILKTAGVRYVLYTGVATNVCVESTLRDGYFLDYWPILVSDACNNSGPDYTRLSSEWNVEHAFGWVTTTRDILKALAGD